MANAMELVDTNLASYNLPNFFEIFSEHIFKFAVLYRKSFGL